MPGIVAAGRGLDPGDGQADEVDDQGGDEDDEGAPGAGVPAD
jgi:hypothetical protein